MSYFDDQMDSWFANNCKGSPENYNPYTDGSGFEPYTQGTPCLRPAPTAKKKTRSQKRNAQRRRAAARKIQEARS